MDRDRHAAEVADLFDRIDDSFPPQATSMAEFVDAVLSEDEIHGKAVLDCGCGPGPALAAFRERGARVLVGMDLSAKALSRAAGSAGEACPSAAALVRGDMLSLPFAPASFDLVFVSGSLPYVRDVEAAFRELLAVLKPGGILLALSLRKGPLEPLYRALRCLFRAFPASWAPVLARLAAFLLRPFQPFFLGREDPGPQRKDLAQTVMEAFCTPTLGTLDPAWVEDALGRLGMAPLISDSPCLEFCSPKTSFIVRVRKG